MTPKVPDYGHQYADKKLAALIRRLHLSYRQARISLQEKIGAYMEQFEKEDAEQRALFDSGELSQEDYMAWRYRKIAGTRQWRDMLEQLTTDMVNQDKIAAGMMRDELPEVYAENHNYGTYQIERDLQMSTSYTLYNRDAVARLLKGNPDLLPQPRVDIPKDARWNRQHIQSSVLQGILTGESMKKIADRMQNVVGMDERAAMRNARTAVTGAENAGKLDSMKRAQELGVQLKKLWLATRDGRTRDSHVMMDGELQEVNEKFSNGCMYPGDPNGAPAEVYNCRCAMRSKVAGADPYSPDLSRNERLGGMSYDEWKRQAGERFYGKLFRERNILVSGLPEDLGFEKRSRTDNPSISQAIKFINPNFYKDTNMDYKHNCQRCTVAWEMSRRGYKVTAKPNPSHGQDFLENHYLAPFKGMSGRDLDVNLWKENHKWRLPGNGKSGVEQAMSDWGNGSRAIVMVQWENVQIAHAFIAENHNGIIRYFDPQTGNSDVSEYFNLAKRGKTEITRVDNLEFTEYIKDCAEKIK